MVAAGATVLMAASEENSANRTENSSSQYDSQNVSSRYNEIQCNQQNNECSVKKKNMPCTSDLKDKNSSHTVEKPSRVASRTETKDGTKYYKTNLIRETKTSRLRAASIMSPSSGTSVSKKLYTVESGSPWNLFQPSTSLSIKEEGTSSLGSSNTMNTLRERDKSHKRKSYLNRSHNTEVTVSDRQSQSESCERRSRRQSSKQVHISETISTSDVSSHHQGGTNLQKKHVESKISSHRTNVQCSTNRSKNQLLLTSTKYSSGQRTNDSHSNSEVSRRVDALTALTKATMERVERLTSHANLPQSTGHRPEGHMSNESTTDTCANNPDNLTGMIHATPASPSKCSILKRSNEEHLQDSSPHQQHTPVSILKHKTLDSEVSLASSNPSHSTLPVTFSPSVVEPDRKRHGILKKRSSLDESEILRRRSCSPDVSFTDNTYSEFKPILKNQRRSSLDEIIKRDQSPDPQPTSILKRKSSREDDGEDRQLGSPEPQGILKRKSGNSVKSSNSVHHVTIAVDVAISGSDASESSEVRPILKKKHSREESSGNDPLFVEPRPILKKKSSTESDEHEDRPKKTILKCSKKSSQEDCNYEAEVASPKKLSMLRNRPKSGLVDSDCVKPILKQGVSRDNESRVRLNFCDTALDSSACIDSEDLFLRKRAQSVGHVQPSVELTPVLNKRRSLESASLNDILYERSQFQTVNMDNLKKPGVLQYDTVLNPGMQNLEETSNSVSVEGCCKQTTLTLETHEKTKVNPCIFSINSSTDKDTRHPVQTTDSKKTDSKLSMADKKQEPGDMCNVQEDYPVHRSNSVSKMAMHFKALQEKAQSVDKDTAPRTRQKMSYGIQRYRERKVQGSDRFNTQPVTFQEVQEAVLQNQRSSNKPQKEADNSTTTEDDFDPSKLSLAERVRLFDKKIVTADVSAMKGLSQERYQRRRPAMRYKTQPITSEEVEVASRLSPLSCVQHVSLDKGCSQESEGSLGIESSSVSQYDLPKGILKPASLHTQNTFSEVMQTETSELEGLKLIKSVLKKESEEHRQQDSDNCDVPSRPILKTNSPLVIFDSDTTDTNRDLPGTYAHSQSKYIKDAIDQCEQQEVTTKADCIVEDSHRAYSTEKSNSVEHVQQEITQKYTVPSYKNNITQDQSCKLKINVVNNVGNVQFEDIYRKHVKDFKSLSITEISHSGNEVSPSEDRDIPDTQNDAVYRRRQAVLTKQRTCNILSKSASHHALGSDAIFVHEQPPVALPGLHRSATQAIEVSESPSMSIADRLAALQRSGNTNWRKRVVSDTTTLLDSTTGNSSGREDLTIKQGVLADCLGKLESATEGWKKRIATTDAIKFTVAGKMKVDQAESSTTELSSPLIKITGSVKDRKKKTPRPERFRAKKGDMKNATSTPASPSRDSPVITYGSFSEPASDDSGEESKAACSLARTVSIPKTDDETFTSFFTGISVERCETECLEVAECDFDVITSRSELLVQKRNIQTQRRRAASRNPLKALAARSDLQTHYTQIRTGVAEKVMKSLNIEKLSKSSSLAVEALAGLASTEDFSAVTLRNTTETTAPTSKFCPYKDLMLILIKGRRHIQVRLVEPVAESINSGDNFVLVTKTEVYNYVGRFSNVIEKTRAAEIALGIQQNKDLGCRASQVITINEEKMSCTQAQLESFWNHLGASYESVNVVDGGHPDEDELYETTMIDTNMVYEVKHDELVPLERYWGAIPKIEMLDRSKILIFDFGTEMYIWSGNGASSDQKRIAMQLAKEMWNEGYDYSECTVCPINAASMLGNRCKSLLDVKKGENRPEWCLLAKLTQHVETVLFREKFLDWPNVSGIIRVRGPKQTEQIDVTITAESCNVNDMIKPIDVPVDLVLEGSHLGRGTGWYDDELMKQTIVTTTSVTVWHIDEFCHTLLDKSSIGHFYAGDSYIVRWMYSMTITGRELSGLPSKHPVKGRDRSAYFMWQGQNASLNEQGAAALLTIELDHDQGPQIRVVQGYEPAAFLNLFSGKMIIHSGKRTDKRLEQRWRLYICRGTLETETTLTEVSCSTRQLRSRTSFVLLDTEKDLMYVWHGSNALPHIRRNVLHAADHHKKHYEESAGENKNITIHEIEEGKEPDEFFNALGGMNRKLYVSLVNTPIQDHTPRLFYLSSTSKEFKPTELLCPHRADLPTPFPFLQDELYQTNQPALFLLDNKYEIWIWQGWWPDDGTEDQTGTKAVRWQAERRAAMTVAMQYWQNMNPKTTKYPVYLVWAGLEPLQFINLFPTWTYRDDIAKLNIEDGRNPGEVLTAESELARLTKSTYPPAQLLQRPLPEGVDPTRLELYLSPSHFEELLGMSKEEFQELPAWKQINLKKEIGLF